MPIEIRELVIRAVVDAGPVAGAPPAPPATTLGEEDRTAIVRQCVDAVMRALARARDR